MPAAVGLCLVGRQGWGAVGLLGLWLRGVPKRRKHCDTRMQAACRMASPRLLAVAFLTRVQPHSQEEIRGVGRFEQRVRRHPQGVLRAEQLSAGGVAGT